MAWCNWVVIGDGDPPSKAPQGDDEQVPKVVVLDEEQELHWHGQQVEHKEPYHFQHEQDTHHKLNNHIVQ